MREQGVNRCKKCGRLIGIITEGIYRKVLVDAEVVMVKADPKGESFVRIDGSKFIGIEQPYESCDPGAEPAYRPHRRTCGVSE